MVSLKQIFKELPPKKAFLDGIRRAPKRELTLNEQEIRLAVRNALRYIPEEWHAELAPEFLDELMTMGRIYGYRFRPEGNIVGKPIDQYVGETVEGRAIQVMIDNNLDFAIALYPYELVTYGETGAVCQNWMQYHLIKAYLEIMTDKQTLVVQSGHPLGLFQSPVGAPRVIVTNGLMIGMFDDLENWNRAAALGVASYGQMTAGGWMYIGPQGIVHGTYSTLLNAGRDKLGIPADQDLAGKLFVTSGLGGMSGAQGKAAVIAGAVGIVAEVDPSRIETRFSQGWLTEVAHSAKEAYDRAAQHIASKTPAAIGFLGNVVELLEYAVEHKVHIDLLSDQTSCHNVYDGGYCPISLSFEERTAMLATDKALFRRHVNEGLVRHYHAIVELTKRGVYFFDYGNSFMKAIYDAGVVEICKNGKNELDGFIWPSYVEDIMGPVLFDYGYGPFRWVCLSGKQEDLDATDAAAMASIDPDRRFQDRDNWVWIRDAKKNQLVVGTKARILYQDALGRLKIALKFNEMVRNGEIGPVMLGRDHHDTGGTDSPFRETSNIKDGSNIMAEMSTHIFAGNAARGMSLIALHNGGGVGIGKSINGGFGMVLDGSERVDEILKNAMPWDVMGGVARRAWARNANAMETSELYNQMRENDQITLPYLADDALIESLFQKK
ncbi:MAG: urocanate hydratase [Bacillota bacterium]|nr:urocanate hydratase [Bacillota bacterium]